MRRDPEPLLWDAIHAIDDVLRFAAGRTLDEVLDDEIVRLAIERQLITVGEALSQLDRLFPDTAAAIPDLRAVVAFRNILVHGYAGIKWEDIWQVIQTDLPALRDTMQTLLDGLGQF